MTSLPRPARGDFRFDTVAVPTPPGDNILSVVYNMTDVHANRTQQPRAPRAPYDEIILASDFISAPRKSRTRQQKPREKIRNHTVGELYCARARVRRFSVAPSEKRHVRRRVVGFTRYTSALRIIFPRYVYVSSTDNG